MRELVISLNTIPSNQYKSGNEVLGPCSRERNYIHSMGIWTLLKSFYFGAGEDYESKWIISIKFKTRHILSLAKILDSPCMWLKKWKYKDSL